MMLLLLRLTDGDQPLVRAVEMREGQLAALGEATRHVKVYVLPREAEFWLSCETMPFTNEDQVNQCNPGISMPRRVKGLADFCEQPFRGLLSMGPLAWAETTPAEPFKFKQLQVHCPSVPVGCGD